jgi:hypothetical protein
MKMKMKTIAIVVAVLTLFAGQGFCQKDSSGIYFMADDFVHHRLSLVIDCKTEKHKIKSDMLFHAKEIAIKHGDSTYIFPKDSIWGIRYCGGSVVRLYDNSAYPLINPTETILIYKVTTGTGMKNNPTVTSYFFSKDETSKIQELTLDNIKAAFPDNHRFHDLIDMQFRNDAELGLYDKMHRIMKINHVLQISTETK